MSAEKQFQKLADDLIENAEAVECSLLEFRDGLETIFNAVDERLEQINLEVNADDDAE